MTPIPEPTALADIDRALRQMRRFFEPPGGVALEEGEAPEGKGRLRIEASTVLVLEAVVDAGATTVRDVAHELDVAHSTGSRLVTRAEQAGVVHRETSPTSGRETHVRVTRLGEEVRERGLQFRLDRLAGMTGSWSTAEVETFARLLARLAEAVTQPGGAARE